MSKSIVKCLQFYKIFKKDKTFRWNEDFEKAFTRVKEYLPIPPILTGPKVGQTLFVYIAESNEEVRTTLIVERNGEQKLVYYTSKFLHGSKVRYQKIKKLNRSTNLPSSP